MNISLSDLVVYNCDSSEFKYTDSESKHFTIKYVCGEASKREFFWVDINECLIQAKNRNEIENRREMKKGKQTKRESTVIY